MVENPKSEAVLQPSPPIEGSSKMMVEDSTGKWVAKEFVSNVSHELLNHITNLKLRLYQLETQPDAWNGGLQPFKREVERFEKLVDGLRLLSCLDQERMEVRLRPTDLNMLVEVYVGDRKLLASEKGLRLDCCLESGIPNALADEDLIGHVLSILLANALTYTPSGGHITVRTCASTSASGIGPCVGWVVEDSGPGVLVEEQAYLFDRFYRGSAGRTSEAQGTGLGLAIAKEIVKRHRGKILVESKGIPGEGARFYVWLLQADQAVV